MFVGFGDDGVNENQNMENGERGEEAFENYGAVLLWSCIAQD